MKTSNSLSITGHQSTYLYTIINDINKFKVLLVFLNKGFTWLRELRSFGIYSKVIEETLNEFNNFGLIEIKELVELDDIKYEVLKTTNQDMQHYFKLYFTTPKINELVSKHSKDFNNAIAENPHLIDFVEKIKLKLKPIVFKLVKIEEEENSQFSRTVTLNGISFEKETKLSKECKSIFSELGIKTKSSIIVKNDKPLFLMTTQEKNRETNKVFYNGKEVNSTIFKEIQEENLLANELFQTGFIGKSLVTLEIEREKRDLVILNQLGIENE